jgi:hypothetical protein
MQKVGIIGIASYLLMIDVNSPIPRIMTTINAQLQCNELYIATEGTRSL